MIRKGQLLTLLSLVMILLSSCLYENNESNSNSIKRVGFNYKLSSKIEKISLKKLANSIVVGTMTAVNIQTGEILENDWRGIIDEDEFTATSNSTFIYPPGEYNFSLHIENGTSHYVAIADNQPIVDGENVVDLVLHPVVGNVSIDFNITELTSLKFKYDPDDIGLVAEPKIGISVDDGVEYILAINPETGISNEYINYSQGSHHIELKLYDGNIQIGKSVDAQEDVVLGINDIIMDFVPLYAETEFRLTMDGGDANFIISIPSVVVEEVGGVSNLKALFKLVGNKNGLREQLLTLELNEQGNFDGEILLEKMWYDTVSIELVFSDVSSENEDIIGSSILEDIELNNSIQNIVFDMNWEEELWWEVIY